MRRILPIYLVLTASVLPWSVPVARGGFAYTTLRPTGSVNGFAYGINDRGDIVGNYATAGGESHGFLLSGGAYSTVSYGLLYGTSVAGVNDAGDMVGYYALAFDSNPGGFKTFGGSTLPLNIPDARNTQALGINAAGRIVGTFEAADGRRSGFLVDGPNFTVLDAPGASTTARGINDAGDVVGSYLGQDGYRGFVLSGGLYTTLSFADDVDTYATGINRLGQIVGYYEDAAGGAHGFLYSNGAFTTLDAPDAVGRTYVYGINASGRMVGAYLGADGFQAFTAVAVPEPASLSLLAGGLGLAFAAGTRARRSPTQPRGESSV
ncbi:HAF repeat-containing PEP-CTERM protein [Paludisphaera soli]|uniref:HAF repeat-containing PEP-CTERM protein n=1 Tax=Paludisphaera soli TaxID=2712865 RepID=UPI0013EC8CEB|nr:HAF repeat-containing PEP-CTERM protein [Paludisphaera soli]